MCASHEGRGHLRERFAAGPEGVVAARVFRFEKRLDVADGENVVCLQFGNRAVQRPSRMMNGGAQTPMTIALVLCSRALGKPNSRCSKEYYLQKHSHAGKHPGGEPPQCFLEAHLHGPAPPLNHSAQIGCPALLPAPCYCLQAANIALWHRCQRCARVLACVLGIHAALRTTGSVSNPPGAHPTPLHRFLPAAALQGEEDAVYAIRKKCFVFRTRGTTYQLGKVRACDRPGPPQAVQGQQAIGGMHPRCAGNWCFLQQQPSAGQKNPHWTTDAQHRSIRRFAGGM